MFKKEINKTDILIIGNGEIGNRHFKIIKKHNKYLNIKKVSSRFFNSNSKKFTLDKEFKPKIIVLANPASLHLKNLKNLSHLDSYYFIEKPLTYKIFNQDLKYINKIININKIYVGYNLRFLNSLIKLKKLLTQKIIGDVRIIKINVGYYLPKWRKKIKYINSVTAQKKLSGGLLFELSHEFDYLLWLFGNIEKFKSIKDKISDLKIDIEDSHFIIGKINKNILFSINFDLLNHAKTRTCEIIGTKNTLIWNGNENSIKIYNKKNDRFTKIFTSKQNVSHTYVKQWIYFYNKYLKNDIFENSFNSSVKIVRMINLIYGAKNE